MSTERNSSPSQTFISETQLTEQIISLYREHPELWQVSHKLYKDRYQRDECIRDIGAKVNLPASDVKARINKLRSQFSAERRKILTRKTGSGADDFKSPKWKWFSSLEFLSDGLQQRATKSNLHLV